MYPRVENMTSSRGNTMPNQFRIFTDEGVYFQSYSTVIAFKPAPKYKGVGSFTYEAYNPIQLDEHAWDYSTTTGKYRNQFLGEKKPQTEAKIKSGEYVLMNLNS